MKNDSFIDRQFLHDRDDVYLHSIYSKYIDSLYAYGRGMCQDEEELKDAIHDVFLNLLLKRSSLGQVRNVRAYLFRSLYNRLVDMKRKYRGAQDITSPLIEMQIRVEPGEPPADNEELGIVASRLEKLINGLSHMQKSSIFMRYMCGMEYGEIADILGVTPHAARKFVSKGIIKMREQKEWLIAFSIPIAAFLMC